jgi:hypothetical protein
VTLENQRYRLEKSVQYRLEKSVQYRLEKSVQYRLEKSSNFGKYFSWYKHTTSKHTTSKHPNFQQKMAYLDSFKFDPEVWMAQLRDDKADEKKRSAETLERDGKRPNLGVAEFDITDYRHPQYLENLFDGLMSEDGPEGEPEVGPAVVPEVGPAVVPEVGPAVVPEAGPAVEPEGDYFDVDHPDFLKQIFGDPTDVATPEHIIPPEPRVRQVRVRHAAVDGVAEDWETLNRRWKLRANTCLGIENFADRNLFPWASVKRHLGTVTPEVRAAIMQKQVPTWGVAHGLPILLVGTAIGTALLKYRGYPYRSCRSRTPVYRDVSKALIPLLGGFKDGVWYDGHIDWMFGSTGEATAWKFVSVDPMQIEVCSCGSLLAPGLDPDVDHDCRADNRMTNDVLIGCAAFHDLTLSNLKRGSDLDLKVNPVGLNCDGPSSASLPLFFIFGGEDELVESTSAHLKPLLADITGEGSREYKQKGITSIERKFTFHQFPVDVTQDSAANFQDFTYKDEGGTLTQIDYPTLIAEWNAPKAKARKSEARKSEARVGEAEGEARVGEASAAPWGVFVPEPPRIDAYM